MNIPAEVILDNMKNAIINHDMPCQSRYNSNKSICKNILNLLKQTSDNQYKYKGFNVIYQDNYDKSNGCFIGMWK